MRIVGGRWRGRQIESPEGRGTTRPTTDRTREQIASMVMSAAGLDLTGASVLDAFAGSGAMGFELVSRGAARATLVDRDRKAVSRIRRSAQTLGAAPGEIFAVGGDALALAERGSLPGAPFDIVFLDPPYALEAANVEKLVGALMTSGQLAPGAIVVYEHAAKSSGLDISGLPVKKTKSRGITALDLHVLEGDQQ